MSPAILLAAALAAPAAAAPPTLSTATIAARIPDAELRAQFLELAALEADIVRQGQELVDLRASYGDAAALAALSERRTLLRSRLTEMVERLGDRRIKNITLGRAFALTESLKAFQKSAGKTLPTEKEIAVYDVLNDYNDELKWIYVGWKAILAEDVSLYDAAKKRVAEERSRRARRSALTAGGAAAVGAVLAAVVWRRRRRRPPAPAATPALMAAEGGAGSFRREGPGSQWTFGRRWPGVTPAGEPAVLQVLAPELVGTGREAERALAHLRAATAFRHPAVSAVTSVGVSSEGVYLTAEPSSGRSLSDLLAAGTAFGLEAAVKALAPVAGALDAAHAAGLVHGGVTPECIRVLPDGSGRLADFGVARALAARPGVGRRVLSPAYSAPEALAGKITLPSDVFSFGVVLYEMLYVRLPFEGTNLEALKEERRHPKPSALLGRPAPAADAFFAGVFEPSARRRRPRVGGLAAALQGLS